MAERKITRAEAEQARRDFLEAESSPCRFPGGRAAAVAVWNEFCIQEQARLDDAERALQQRPSASWLFAGRGSGARR